MDKFELNVKLSPYTLNYKGKLVVNNVESETDSIKIMLNEIDSIVSTDMIHYKGLSDCVTGFIVTLKDGRDFITNEINIKPTILP